MNKIPSTITITERTAATIATAITAERETHYIITFIILINKLIIVCEHAPHSQLK